MTVLSPPRPGADTPLRRTGATPVSPAMLVIVTLAALLLVALFNCDQLVQLAKQMPYGSQRTAALDVAKADQDVSHALWLDRPRHGLDRLFGHGSSGGGNPLTPITPIRPTPSATPSAPASATPSTPATTAPPSAAHPLRVFLGGDSIAEDVGSAFQQLATDSKVVSFDDAARISTGLTRPDYFDWPARLRQVLTGSHPPQVVIVMVGGNDVQPILTPKGPAAFGTAAWFAEYRRRVAGTMAMLTSGGADVYWVGQPLMRSAELSRQLDRLDAIFAAEAASHPGVTFVDARPLLADAHGRYAEYLPGAHGTLVQVRWGDGFHLTPAGALRVAQAVWDQMRNRWNLPAY